MSEAAAISAETAERETAMAATPWLDPAVRAAHAALSPASAAFLDFVAADPDARERASFAPLARRTSFNPYPLQPWPAFVDRERVAELERVSVGLCRLVKSVPRRLFDDDPERISRFYDLGSADRARSLLAAPTGIDAALGRGDFLLTADGLQCLEFNLVSHLGGWKTSRWAPLYLESAPIARFLAGAGLEARCRDTVRLLFAHLLDQAQDGDRGDLDIAFVVPDELQEPLRGDFAAYLAAEYAAELAASRKSGGKSGGEAFLCGYGDLREADGYLFLGARRIGAVVEVHDGTTPGHAFRCFKAGHLDLYNAPIRTVLSDKRNLALLSELAGGGRFDRQERELIERHVPWTRRLAAERTVWRDERAWLPDLVQWEREAMVLKQAGAGQGTGVHVGLFTPEKRWGELVAEAVAAGGWVVQERVESLPFLHQQGERGAAPHEVVWGLFAFGDRYAGAFLSLRPKGEGGVVNVHQGASEGIVFEVEPREAVE